jgi:predicted HTH domain antitoxin
LNSSEGFPGFTLNMSNLREINGFNNPPQVALDARKCSRCCFGWQELLEAVSQVLEANFGDLWRHPSLLLGYRFTRDMLPRRASAAAQISLELCLSIPYETASRNFGSLFLRLTETSRRNDRRRQFSKRYFRAARVLLLLAMPVGAVYSAMMELTLPLALADRLSHQNVALHLAIGLFVTEEATLGQAAQVAGLSQTAFLRELGRRQIPIHYGVEELAEDLRAVESLATR